MKDSKFFKVSSTKGRFARLNIDKHLILIKDEDKTEEISWCMYENGKWQVKFIKGKTYSYQHHSVEWYRNPVLLDPAITVVYQNNQPLYGVEKIFDFGGYIRIYFVTGYKKVYCRKEITVEQSCLNNQDKHSKLEYLKQLAKKVV